jgi:ankyrin repeat protein
MNTTLVADDFGDDWSWLGLGLGKSPFQLQEDLATKSIAEPQKSPSKLRAMDTTSANLFNEFATPSSFDFPGFDRETHEQLPMEFPKELFSLNPTCGLLHHKHNNEMGNLEDRSQTICPPPLTDEWILPDFGMVSMQSTPLLSHLPTVSITTESISLDTPEFVIEDCDLNRTDLGFAPSSTKIGPDLFIDQAVSHNALPGEPQDNETRLPSGGRPSRESIASLNERLPDCSQSCIEDIVSILERHTIGGSSVASSSARTSHISSKKSSRVFLKQSEIERGLSLIEEPPLLPVKVKPPNVLPGIFHIYCAAQLDQNKLRHCRHDGMPCEHASPNAQRYFTSHIASKVVIYSRVRSQDINERDQFGNSILHVAASFCAPIPYIIKLIKEKANINVTNTAGETFLHLLYAPYEEDEVCSLLEFLSIQRFNFGQHDQHGQTSLHLITRPWLPQQYLVKVIRKIHSLGFVLPTSRDNLGFTLLRQMKHLGTQALGFDPGGEMAFRLSLGLTCETQGYIVRPHNPVIVANSTSSGNSSWLHHDEKQNRVHNLDDLRRYEHHADLLRTIIKAGDRPWYEDSKGRNGLHCLAEVAFDLPIPDQPSTQNPSPQDQRATNRNALREAYLESLIAAGVNPNNYDKKGNTPLMLFLTYRRTGEDDSATISILNKLLDAKADIHRRNRRGDTALHLAIKSGRLGATNLLLRKGANVHARNKKGSGILKVGTEACKKATGNENLYAQIMLCMDAAMRAGAVSSPTIIQEWSLERASQENTI